LSVPSVNIGLVGHVDHGKTTLVAALSGVWTDQHSEEIKRGISIRLGYADCTFYRCPQCKAPTCYSSATVCSHCGKPTEELRSVSFVDSPGHETLMATMLSGAAIMHGAVLVISANEPCPQPQTKEHLMALDIAGIRHIVIAQNKVDLATREQAMENYRQIKEFVRGTVAENAPIVPISSLRNVNLEVLMQTIDETIPTPKFDTKAPMLMPIARSFDVNRPGTIPEKLVGGVIGGTLKRGVLHKGDEVEILPGLKVEAEGRTRWEPIHSTVTNLIMGKARVDEVTPGGLFGAGTRLDPHLTKGDNLVGQVAGAPGTLPPVWDGFKMNVRLLERVVGTAEESQVGPIASSEMLMLSVGTATTVGRVKSAHDKAIEVELKRPVCAEKDARIAISRRLGSRWRLIGVGELLG